ncbi:hypothetical protein K458DRAFT_161886 [Lentithecium fluviatile CBS 122367]|uniref:Uncharacterized protein n=1 Tax=Lentithecium fluviatile CBS 122367 TaxID=1168545 RepID=A0A6G1IGM6_9PLEO|nr:hypothetical protein K458DRAFT_161886 [Lentithecium fluviatile CBS 122367]
MYRKSILQTFRQWNFLDINPRLPTDPNSLTSSHRLIPLSPPQPPLANPSPPYQAQLNLPKPRSDPLATHFHPRRTSARLARPVALFLGNSDIKDNVFRGRAGLAADDMQVFGWMFLRTSVDIGICLSLQGCKLGEVQGVEEGSEGRPGGESMEKL